MPPKAVAEPQPLDPQVPTPYPVDCTYTSKPVLIWYTASVAEPPFPESLALAVTVDPAVSLAVIVYVLVPVTRSI